MFLLKKSYLLRKDINMKYSVEIHPDSNCYDPFSQFISHQYKEWLDEKETKIKFEKFEKDQKISQELVGTIPFPSEDDDNDDFLNFAIGTRNESICFFYKEEPYYIQVITRKTNLARIERGIDKHYVYFIVNFENFSNFSELGRVSRKWYKNFIDSMIKKPDKILIYSNDDGFFRRIGKKSKRSLETVLLPEDDKQKVIDKITNFLKPETKSLYKRLGKNYKLIFLFHGLPGTGKTSFIHSIASHFNRDICIYSHDKKMGDTDFNKLIRTVEKKILCLEDMDCLFNTRETEDKHGITFSGILNTLDGFLSPQGEEPFFCFITTNCIEKLDKTLIRPGRVDHSLEFGEIKKKERRKMFINYFEEEKADEFEKAFSDLKTKVTPATLEMYLFGYIGSVDKAIENVLEILTLKNFTSSDSNKGIYC